MITIILTIIPLLILIGINKALKIKFPKLIDIILYTFLSFILSGLISSIMKLIIPGIGLWSNLSGILPFAAALLLAALPEELVKYINIKLNKPKTNSQLLVTAIYVGCVFAVIENYAYFANNLSTSVIILRLSCLHIFFEILMASLLIVGNKKNNKGIYTCLALIVPILIHALYNTYASNFNNTIIMIITISSYIITLVAMLIAKKMQTTENNEIPEKVKFRTAKIIITIILLTFWIFSFHSYDSITKINEPCKYNNFTIKVLETEKVELKTIYGVRKCIRVRVSVKNNDSTSKKIDTIFAFTLVNKKDGEKVMTYMLSKDDVLKEEIAGNSENTGNLFFEVDGEINDYKLTYDELTLSEKKNNKCDFSLE